RRTVAIGACRIEPVEERLHRRQRPAVAVDQRCVADAEPEQEAVGVAALEIVLRSGDALRVVHPDVEDPGCDAGPLRRGEEALDGSEDRTAQVGDPEHVEAKLLELSRRIDDLVRIAEPKLSAPDAERAERRPHALPQTSSATWTTSSSLRRCASHVMSLPSALEPKPHCVERASRSSGTYLLASSMRCLSSSAVSRFDRFVVSRPSTTCWSSRAWRSGSKPPERSSSYSSRSR